MSYSMGCLLSEVHCDICNGIWIYCALYIFLCCNSVDGYCSLRYKQFTSKYQELSNFHEDNQGALTLAKLEPGLHTPRSKFYAIKLHWFSSWLNPIQIGIIFYPTHLQKADSLTKPLTKEAYSQNRSFPSVGN